MEVDLHPFIALALDGSGQLHTASPSILGRKSLQFPLKKEGGCTPYALWT